MPPANRPGSNAGTMIAAMLVLACAAGFFLLVVIVNPFIIGILVIPLIVVPLGVVQYLLWGRWLAKLQAEEKEREAEK